jgi:hypothetical protein
MATILPLPAPSDPGWQAYLDASQALLRLLSDGTGGFVSVDGDLVTELRRVNDAMR